MKRLILNKKQLFEMTDDPNEKPTRVFNATSPAQLPNMINGILNTGDTENVNNQIVVGRVNQNSPTYNVDANTDTSEIEQNSVVNVNRALKESYTKKEVEQMRLNEIKRNGIKLTKRELNEFLNS